MERELAVKFFSGLFGGKHHIPAPGHEGEHGVREYGDGWYVCYWGGLATWDMSRLTQLVFLAHHYGVRAEVSTAGRYLRIAIHQRTRDRSSMRGHPTLEQAVGRFRAGWPQAEEA